VKPIKFPKATKKARREFDAWLWTRPAVIRRMAKRFDPFTPYRVKATGQVGFVVSWNEGGTMRLRISEWFQDNPKIAVSLTEFDLEVFGLRPKDLMPYEAAQVQP